MFEVISTPKKKSFYVAQQILEKIQTGQLVVGDKLPPERIIAKSMGVSRSILREAISALQLSGVVETRMGDGTYVKSDHFKADMQQPDDPLVKGLVAGIDIIEAIEAREALDIASIHLAIENAQPGDHVVCRQLVDEMRQAIGRKDFMTYLKLTLRFHEAIATLGGNRFVEESVSWLVDIVGKDLWLLEQNYTSTKAEESFEIHRLMLEAIEKEDLELAIQAVKRHYREYPSLK